jgi:hypothetical protein
MGDGLFYCRRTAARTGHLVCAIRMRGAGHASRKQESALVGVTLLVALLRILHGLSEQQLKICAFVLRLTDDGHFQFSLTRVRCS